MLRNRTGIVPLACVTCLAAATAAIHGDDGRPAAIRDGFESAGTVWKQEQTDAAINLLAHDRSRRAAHEGRLSEHFRFEAGPVGSAFYYSYALPNVPATDDLTVNLFVRANRPGIRIYGRVILPADTDPDTGEPSYVLVPGTIYENADRWQRLELSGMRPSIEAQARVIRAMSRRPVSLEGAYLERIVVNLYCGGGETEAFLDDLSLAPVPPGLVTGEPRPAAPAAGMPPARVEVTPEPPRAPARVALDRNRLKRGGYDWVVTAIEAPGADVGELRKAGFDVLADDINADPERFREAISRGFLLQPNLSVDGEPLEPAQALAAAASFPFRDSVAFWKLGDQLGSTDDPQVRKEERERVRAIISGFRGLPRDFSHLTTATVVDDFSQYARAPQSLDIMGVRPYCWGSSNDALDTYSYFDHRRALTVHFNPGGLFCAWLPATAPPELRLNVWGDDAPPSWGYPAIQPEQLRFYTYLALSAGYRGIGFRGDADLTRNPNGRMLLIEMALLNEEIDLFESILAQGADPIGFYPTYPTDPPAMPPPGSMNVNQRVKMVKEFGANPFTKFASIDMGNRKGSLLLVHDYYIFNPYQPLQMAMNNLKLRVPARESAQAWVVSPGGVEALTREKVPGGIQFNLPDYGPTALVLVTTDLGLPERIRAEVERVRPLAVQLAIEQSELQLRWVSEINGRLLADGHRLYDPTDPRAPRIPPGFPPPNDEALLLAKSEDLIKSAREALEREDYELAWAEARRATRPLRILMTAHWTKAFTAMTKVAAPYPEDLPKRRVALDRREPEKAERKPPRPLVPPISSPPLLSFNLLPQHYIWVDWMRKAFSSNLVPSGSFDESPSFEALESVGWTDVSRPFEGIKSTIEIARDPVRGRVLKFSVNPDDDLVDKVPPFLDFMTAAVRSPEVPVKAGQFLRISVDLKKPYYHASGHEGLIIRDSIGGEPLQFRFHDVAAEYTRAVIFRRAPADGVFSVVLGLAGYKDAYLKDFKIEVAEGPSPESDLAGPTPPPLPDAMTPPRPDPATARRPPPLPRTNR